MTPREGFKYGFLLRCAEEGLTAKQAEARAARGLEKRGAGMLGSFLGGLGGGAASAITSAPQWIPKLGLGVLGAGALATGLGGYALGKMQEGDVDPEEVQREELINAYRTQAELARRKEIMDAVTAAQPRPRSRHGI